MGPATISRWLSGESKPAVDMCRRIADALNVDLDLVLEKAGYRPQSMVGDVSERAGVLSAMVRRVNWDDDTRYFSVFRLVRGYVEDDRAVGVLDQDNDAR